MPLFQDAITPGRPLAVVLAVVLAAAALAGCQTTDANNAAAFADGPGKSFRERRGWVVDFIPAENGAPAHCRGRRAAASPGPAIAFIGAEGESGFRVSGLSAEKLAAAGEAVTASFDHGDRQEFKARKDGDSLLALFPTDHYEDVMHAFSRGRSVDLRNGRGVSLAEVSLSGSSWAINATDECRRMNAAPRRMR